MNSTIGVSSASASISEPSRVILHLLPCHHANFHEERLTSVISNPHQNQQQQSENHSFPSYIQPNDDPMEEDDNLHEEDLQASHLVVQGPVHMQGTAQQVINYINHRINPKEQEPRMYFRPLPAGPQQDFNDDHDPIVELVVSTKCQDDVQVQVEEEGSHQMQLFLQVISQIRIHTFYIRESPNNKSIPACIATSLDKALSNHQTLKRLWLEAMIVTTAAANTHADTTHANSISSDSGAHYKIAASILKHKQSCIQDIMVEGCCCSHTSEHHQEGITPSDSILPANLETFLKSLEENESVQSISFVKSQIGPSSEHHHDQNLQVTAILHRLAKSLCVNRSIHNLYIGNLLDYLSYKDVELFAKSICKMKGLKVLDLRLLHRLVLPRPDLRYGHQHHLPISHGRRNHHHHHHAFIDPDQPIDHSDTAEQSFPTCLLKPIIDALEENCSLMRIPGWKKYFNTNSPASSHDNTTAKLQKERMKALEDSMSYQLQLNRSHAKQFVFEPGLSMATWPLVLSKSCRGNPTAMYYCLRYKVASVCN